jgi:hypothetical protein
MGRKLIDLTGQKFGRLLVLEKIKSEDYDYTVWLCQCDCGSDPIVVSGGHLTRSTTITCGCPDCGRTLYFEENDCVVGKFTHSEQIFLIDKESYYKLGLKQMRVVYKDDDPYLVFTGGGKSVYLHRFLMNAEDADIVDHKNKKTLDNRIANLRICTKQENAFNHKLSKINTSGVSGIVQDKTHKKWVAQITIGGKNLRLGTFEDKADAIVTRLKAEALYFGDFAPQKHLFERFGVS